MTKKEKEGENCGSLNMEMGCLTNIRGSCLLEGDTSLPLRYMLSFH